MKRILISTILAVGIGGCSGEPAPNIINDKYYTEKDFSVACLDGTEYWLRAAGYRGYMAVKIDRETRQPASCDSE